MEKIKKALVIRIGAFGDCVLITPVIARLKELGYHITLYTGERGMDIFKHDTRIDKFIEHKKETPIDDLHKIWKKLEKQVKYDEVLNFTESIECNVALHPVSPMYVYPKKERAVVCNKNYYEVTADISKFEGVGNTPSLMFTKEEEYRALSHIKDGKFNILWCLSGSGKNKVYPWTDYVIGDLVKSHPNVHIITVGDNKCQILEDVANTFPKENITQLAGKISIRESMALTKLVDLVISPDTGLLHSSGCFDTPKIGLLGHTTIENITKHFKNDYSLESDCECAPCFRLIYEYDVQCPIDPVTNAAWCMANIKPKRLYNRIVEVIDATS